MEPQPGDNRDHGKRFLITEMSAYAADRWANRATLALSPRLSRELPEDTAAALQENPSMPGVGRIMTILSGIQFPELDPLLRELWECVEIVEDRIGTRKTTMDDIEEVATIHYLRQEALDIHVNFMLAASILGILATTSMVSILSSASMSGEQ